MQSTAMMGYGVCQWGRHPDGRKRRWTRAQKSAVKRARVEEWLSIARQWKHQKEEETGEDRNTTPTWGGSWEMGRRTPLGVVGVSF